MTKKELVNYVKQQFSQGVNPEVLRFVLVSDGWKEQDIEEIFRLAKEEDPKPKPVQPAVAAPAPVQPPVIKPAPVAKTVPKSTPVRRVEPPVAAQSISGVPAPTRRAWFSKKIGLGAAVVLVVLLGVGYGAYAYYKQTPGYVLKKTFANPIPVESLEYSGTVTAEVSGTGPLGFGAKATLPVIFPDGGKVAGLTTYQGVVTFNGRTDMRTQDNPRSELTLNLETQGMTLKGDVKVLGKTLYAKAERLPDWKGFDVEKLYNQWISIDLEESKGLYPINGAPETDVTAEQKAQILESWRKHQVFKVVESSKEDLSGLPVYRFVVEIDKSQLTDYLTEVLEITGNGAMVGDLVNWDKFEFAKSEIWVGRQDYYIHKIKSGFSMDEKETAFRLSLDLNFGNYNQPMEITAPSSFKSFKQMIQEVSAEATVANEERVREERRMFDVAQIQAALKLYLDDFGKYPKLLGELSKNSKSAYLYAIPSAPIPPGVGCTADQNAYVYKQLQQGKSYSLNFCLGQNNAQGLGTGSLTAGPDGIK